LQIGAIAKKKQDTGLGKYIKKMESKKISLNLETGEFRYQDLLDRKAVNCI
jgi:hypothetical protein